MLRVVVVFVTAMLATSTMASAINSDCKPSSRNADCPRTQPHAHQLEHLNDGSSQPSFPLEAVGVWGFSEIGCELYRARRIDDEFSNTPSSNYGIINISNFRISWIYWEAASCAIATDEISTSRLSISFPAHCASKNQMSGQFVIINMRGDNSMRLTFLANKPFFKSDDYVRCSTNQETTLRSAEKPKAPGQVSLHEMQLKHQQKGLQKREQRARRLERKWSKVAEKHKAKLRNPLTQISSTKAYSNWPKTISPALFTPEF
jgi:hypothetical protein